MFANIRLKNIFTVFLTIVLLGCFTFNAFAIDIVSKTQDPQIVIDGRDNETVWMESDRFTFVDSSNNVPVGIDMLHYKNKIYGAITLDDIVENGMNLVIRIDFHYKKDSAHMVFVMENNQVLYGDGDFYMEGFGLKNETGYCAEFVFSAERNVFEYGDLIQIEVKYGWMNEIVDYENIYGFSGREMIDYYVGGQIIESVKPEKTPSYNKNETTKIPTTNKSGATVYSSSNTTNFNSNYNSDVNLDGSATIRETEIIITVMMITCVVTVVISVAIRKPNKKEKENKYTDDDKGCD